MRARASGGQPRGVDRRERGVSAAATTTSCCSRCRAKGGGAMRSVARHVADPPLTKIGVFTKDPRELVIDARRGTRTHYRKDSNTLRIAESYWRKAIATLVRRHGLRVALRDPDARFATPKPACYDGERNRRCCRKPAHACSSRPRRIARAKRRRPASASGPASRPPIPRSSRSAASSASKPRTRATAACGR